MVRVNILGDLAPVGRASQPFREGNQKWFIEKLGDAWAQADARLVNLECPLIETESPIRKIGPNLGVMTSCASVLSVFSAVGLANNHIMDHGQAGLSHTMNLLRTSGIPYIGAGTDINEAGKPCVLELNGMRIGVLAWSHHEFCIATEDTPGAFPIDFTYGLSCIKSLRESCDFIILLYHGGIEHYPLPSPRQRRTCRFLAEMGVDLIVCQHSHIIGASEVVGKSTILYGQGNYCFDYSNTTSMPHWRQGLMLDIGFDQTDGMKVNYIPIVQDEDADARPCLASRDIADSILKKQREDSEVLSDDLLYKDAWNEFAKGRTSDYLYQRFPVGRVGRKLLRMVGLMDSAFGRRQALQLLSHVQCEAHVDTLVAGSRYMVKDT